MFAQSVIDYGGISLGTAARDAAYSIKSWYRGNPQTAWMVVIGMLLLMFFLRKGKQR